MSEDYRITDLQEFSHMPEREGRKFRWLVFIPLTLLIITTIGAGVYYLLWKKKSSEGISKLHKFSDGDLKDQKLLPSEIPNDLELQQAIQQYKDSYLKAAKANFYDILQSTKSAQIKSFAATYLGIISDEEGKFTLAIDFFQRATRFAPNNFHAYYNLAIALKNSGRYSDAIRALEEAEKLRPELVDARVLKGKIEYERNDLSQAEDTLKSITERGRNPLAIYNLAKVYKKQGKITEAKAGFLDALNLAGSGEVAYQAANELGILYATSSDADLPNAKEYFQRAISLAPYNPKYFYNLALVEYRSGNKRAAVDALNRTLRYGGDNPKTYTYIARLYNEMNQPDKAENALRKGLEGSPNEPDVLSALADTLVSQSKWDQAIRILNKVFTTSTKTLQKSQALYHLGLVYTELKDWGRAVDSLKRSQVLDPTNDDVLLALGRVYTLQEQPHKAVSIYKSALRLNPSNNKLLQQTAKLYIRLGLLSEAEEILNNLIESSKSTSENTYFAYYNLGKIHKERKDYNSSINYFKKVLEANSDVYLYSSLLEISDTILLADKPAPLSYPYLQKAISLEPRKIEPRYLLAKALLKEDSIESRETAEEELLSIIETNGVDSIILSKTHTLRGILYYKEGLYLKALDDFNRALELDPSNDDAFQNKRATASKLEGSG